MTTRIEGIQYFETANDPQPFIVKEVIEGDSGTEQEDTARLIFLDGLDAMVRVHNTHTRGMWVTVEGAHQDSIQFTRENKPIPYHANPITEGFPLGASVPEAGKIRIWWEPKVVADKP